MNRETAYIHRFIRITPLFISDFVEYPLHLVTSFHKDVTERLEKINSTLMNEVRVILEENKAERHIRGGEATKAKYQAK